MAWFKKQKQPKVAPTDDQRAPIPEGLWVKCASCKEIIYRKEVAARANVCPKCNYHFRIGARERLAALFGVVLDVEKLGARHGASRLSIKDPYRR